MDAIALFESEVKKNNDTQLFYERIKAEKEEKNHLLMTALMGKLEPFNRYGFGFYLAREYNNGWKAYDDPDYHYYIRSKFLLGYICHCEFDGDELLSVRTTFTTGNITPRSIDFGDFVKKLATYCN